MFFIHISHGRNLWGFGSVEGDGGLCTGGKTIIPVQRANIL